MLPRMRGFLTTPPMLAGLGLLLAGCTVQHTPDAGGGGADIGPATDIGVLVRPDAPLADAGFVACESTSAGADRVPATLLLQLDTSGSMNCAASDRSCLTGDPTPAPNDSRWDVLRARMNDALAALPDTDRAGLMHFPVTFSCAGTDAQVPIAPLSSARVEIASALERFVPMGITPTHDAVANALSILRDTAGTSRYLVLATDGAATTCLGCDAACSFEALDRDNEALVARVSDARAAGLSTFVIGVPGSQSYRTILSRMASAGGTAREGCSDAGPRYCHHDLTDAGLDFSTALRDALAAIGESVISCEYTIPSNPEGSFDPSLVNVRIETASGTTDVPRDPSRTGGWDYDDAGTHIVLHGSACEAARAESTTRVEVLFGCPTILL